MKSYNIVDCVGVLIRKPGKRSRFYRFKTPQRRGAVSDMLDRIMSRHSVTRYYAQTTRGTIF